MSGQQVATRQRGTREVSIDVVDVYWRADDVDVDDNDKDTCCCLILLVGLLFCCAACPAAGRVMPIDATEWKERAHSTPLSTETMLMDWDNRYGWLSLSSIPILSTISCYQVPFGTGSIYFLDFLHWRSTTFASKIAGGRGYRRVGVGRAAVAKSDEPAMHRLVTHCWTCCPHHALTCYHSFRSRSFSWSASFWRNKQTNKFYQHIDDSE